VGWLAKRAGARSRTKTNPYDSASVIGWRPQHNFWPAQIGITSARINYSAFLRRDSDTSARREEAAGKFN